MHNNKQTILKDLLLFLLQFITVTKRAEEIKIQ